MHPTTQTAVDIAEAILALAPSGLFDAPWYRAEYGGAAATDPLVEFCDTGWRALRRPNACFDTGWYLRQNPDVAELGLNPLLHYLRYGEGEDRPPNAGFDVGRYRIRHGQAAGGSCLAHALASVDRDAAATETGLSAAAREVHRSGLFDARHYRAAYGMAGSDLGLLEHFCTCGWRERLDPNRLFDTGLYLDRNGDVRDGDVNPLLHYITDGAAEHRPVSDRFDAAQYGTAHGIAGGVTALAACIQADHQRADLLRWLQSSPPAGDEVIARMMAVLAASCLFDENFYLIHYPDVRLDGAPPLEHFCRHGEREGRRPNPYFDPTWYRATYATQDGAVANALLHYVLLGEAAGHRPIVYFDPGWYAGHYGIAPATSPLLHYLQTRRQHPLSPVELFDATGYAGRFGDAIGPNRDVFAHYLRVGIASDVDPGPSFDAAKYRSRFMAAPLRPFQAVAGAEIHERIRREPLNPLVHFLLNAGAMPPAAKPGPAQGLPP